MVHVIIIYRILLNTHASPDVPPPQKFLDHVPEVSSPKIYMTMQFNDQFNTLFVVSHEIIQMYTKNSALSQLITVTGPKPQVAILFQ